MPVLNLSTLSRRRLSWLCLRRGPATLALGLGIALPSVAATGFEAVAGAESSVLSGPSCSNLSSGGVLDGAEAVLMGCASLPTETNATAWARGELGALGPDLHARASMQFTDQTLKTVGGAVRISAGGSAAYLDRLVGVPGGLNPAVVHFDTHLDGVVEIHGHLNGDGSKLVFARGINQLTLFDEASGDVLASARAVVTSQGPSFTESLLGGRLQAQVSTSATGGWDIRFNWNTLGWSGAPVIVRMALGVAVVADGTTSAGALPVPPMPWWLGGFFSGTADFGNTLHWTALTAQDAAGQDITAQALRLDGALFGIEAPSPVPEPAHAALLAAGLAVLAWRLRWGPEAGAATTDASARQA